MSSTSVNGHCSPHLLFGVILVYILMGSLSAYPKSTHFLRSGVGVKSTVEFELQTAKFIYIQQSLSLSLMVKLSYRGQG